jgi:nicotinamide mononucleotide adenylyltransferase
LKDKFDYKKQTSQMLGRFQPWHRGHRFVFEEALSKTGQVAILVRDCQNWNDSNPFDFEFVKSKIEEDLLPEYDGKFIIERVPNITKIVYGRDVGYSFEEVLPPEEIGNISATKIRKEMGYK